MKTYYPLGNAPDMSEAEYQAAYANPDPDLMGEEAYVAACGEIVGRGDAPPKALGEKVGYWRTRDGRVLAVGEMTDAHLANAVRLFVRAGWGEHPKVSELIDELVRRAR